MSCLARLLPKRRSAPPYRHSQQQQQSYLPIHQPSVPALFPTRYVILREHRHLSCPGARACSRNVTSVGLPRTPQRPRTNLSGVVFLRPAAPPVPSLRVEFDREQLPGGTTLVMPRYTHLLDPRSVLHASNSSLCTSTNSGVPLFMLRLYPAAISSLSWERTGPARTRGSNFNKHRALPIENRLVEGNQSIFTDTKTWPVST